MTRADRILAVTSELPWPLDTGGHLRSYHLLRALASEFDLNLVTSSTSDTNIRHLTNAGVSVWPVRLGSWDRTLQLLRVPETAVRRKPYVLYGRHAHARVRRAVRTARWACRPTIAYLDHLDSATFMGELTGLVSVVDLHNRYSLVAERAAQESGPLARAYLKREADLLRKVECDAAASADLLFVVSAEEAGYFRQLGARNVCLVTNGVDCAKYAALPTGRSDAAPLILYIGTMSWPPNAGAALFLATEVLPRVRMVVPGTTLRIVGKDPPSSVVALDGLPGIEVTGSVADVAPHLAAAAVLAVPLQSGGGTRLKILEAFAAGLPVVSTSIGSEGLGVEHGRELLIAPQNGFASAVAQVVTDRCLAAQLAARARARVRRDFDWSAVGAVAVSAIRATVRHRRHVQTA